ncbi:MAG TPA: hypothetical protein VFL93_09600 [Longimicrobiaceae bacterium]|jgi:hypothetical protein|nr:hypothetical protein [Longimicrobiaceae bacterium]
MDEKDPRKAVNPAARRDTPRPRPRGEAVEKQAAEREVKPTQTEPLNPLSPGGIGG